MDDRASNNAYREDEGLRDIDEPATEKPRPSTSNTGNLPPRSKLAQSTRSGER